MAGSASASAATAVSTERSYGVRAQARTDLGVRRLRLITNNSAKYGGLDGHSLIIVGRVGLPARATEHNVRYLRTKRERMGHVLDVHRAVP